MRALGLAHGAVDSPEQLPLFDSRLHAHSLEVSFEPDVGVQARRILVEVKEGARSAIEHPALLLDESGNAAELVEQSGELVERFLGCVAHESTLGRGRHAVSR